MDRLTRRSNYDTAVVCDNCQKHGNCNIPSTCLNVLADRLAEYEDTGLTPEEINTFHNFISKLSGELAKYKEAEQDGRLIVLPCKVGDTVWKIVRHRVDASGYRMEWEWETMIEAVKFRIGMTDAVGKTVFLTREEAEAALEEKK